MPKELMIFPSIIDFLNINWFHIEIISQKRRELK